MKCGLISKVEVVDPSEVIPAIVQGLVQFSMNNMIKLSNKQK